jgi:hypothetical protein
MFHYTYKFETQVYGTSHYIMLNVNQELSDAYYSGRSKSSLNPPLNSLADKVLKSVAQVHGVLSADAGLLVVQGNKLTVQTSALTVAEKRRVTQSIVKRLKRMIAPLDSVKCIRFSDLQKEFEKVNKRLA